MPEIYEPQFKPETFQLILTFSRTYLDDTLTYQLETTTWNLITPLLVDPQTGEHSNPIATAKSTLLAATLYDLGWTLSLVEMPPPTLSQQDHHNARSQ